MDSWPGPGKAIDKVFDVFAGLTRHIAGRHGRVDIARLIIAARRRAELDNATVLEAIAQWTSIKAFQR